MVPLAQLRVVPLALALSLSRTPPYAPRSVLRRFCILGNEGYPADADRTKHVRAARPPPADPIPAPPEDPIPAPPEDPIPAPPAAPPTTAEELSLAEGSLRQARLRINELAGRDVDCSSRKDLCRLLFEELGLPVLERTAKGQPALTQAALERFAEGACSGMHGAADDRGVPQALLRVRECEKAVKRLEKRLAREAQSLVHDAAQSEGGGGGAAAAPEAAAPRASPALSLRDALVVIDGSGIIFRAYHALPPLHRQDGMPVNAVLGFCSVLNRLLLPELERAASLGLRGVRAVLVMDPGSPRSAQQRAQLFPAYKADRGSCPEDLVPQFALVEEAAAAYGLPVVRPAAAHEADDLIAAYVRAARGGRMGVGSVAVVSYDKDLMQLVTEEEGAGGLRVRQLDPTQMRWTGPDEVRDRFGVDAAQLADYLALTGDRSDGVPGVRGIGAKTAAQLLGAFGDLEGVLEAARRGGSGQTKKREAALASEEGRDSARISRRLVELEAALPLPGAPGEGGGGADATSGAGTFEGVVPWMLCGDTVERVIAFAEENGLNAMATTLRRRSRAAP